MLPVAQGWNKVGIEADKQNSFCAQSVHSRVGANLGPIVVVGNLKQSAIAALRGRVSDRLVVEVCQFPAMPEDLIDRFRLALEMHESGEPFLPERLVAALLLVRKLEKYHYWGGGAKDKSYLWADDVAKGRGIPATLATIVKEVANQLALKGLLKTKRSQGGTKYALEPKMRKEIMRFLEERKLDDLGLHKYLFGGAVQCSARMLDRLDEEPTA